MKKLWSPSESFKKESNLYRFLENQGLPKPSNYKAAYDWSIKDPREFWNAVLNHFKPPHSGSSKEILRNGNHMIEDQWFPDLKISYSEVVFSHQLSAETAITFRNEIGNKRELSWQELKEKVSDVAEYFKRKGLGVNSKIVAFLPNIPEAIIAFLACNSIGAIWSSCSPDFGVKSVIDRFQQIEPDLLLVANGYWYNGKTFDKRDANEELIHALKSLKAVVSVNYCSELGEFKQELAEQWENIPSVQKELKFERVAFNHPIWVLYSSGTTGLPKAITHGTGGIVLEHLKALSFHHDLKQGEKFLWYSTTGWMMWNYANAALLLGATVAIYDGSPAYPSSRVLWDFVKKEKIQHFGAGASFFAACMKNNLSFPSGFPELRSLGSTGSPLSESCFEWIYEAIKSELWLISLSGGTDICSGFVGGNPFDDVYSGEIQCRMLGVDLKAFNETGEPVVDELGEMVITHSIPSMPIYFWNDANKSRYRSSYYEHYENVWRHGDFIRISSQGSIVIFGRSDSTLNRGGVRIGTSEVYAAVESIEAITDSIVVCIDKSENLQELHLFVLLKDSNAKLNEELHGRIKKELRQQYSPRHIPDFIHQCPAIPYTISGKKMEAAVKSILSGKELKVARGSMKNPESLVYFQSL